MTTATAHINGVDITYSDSGGTGMAVLFSHGFMMNRSMFDQQIAALTPRFRCVAWDERGFGETTAVDSFTYWDSADDAVGLLDHLGIASAVFVGMSQGGFLSMRAAMAHPKRVHAMVLIDSAADADGPETIAGYHAMLAAMTGPDEPTFDAVAAGVAQLILGNQALADAWIPKWKARRASHDLNVPGQTLLSRDDVTHRLGEITCPVLIIHGSADQAIELERAQAVASAVPHCRGVVVIDGGSHASNMTHPQQVNDALLLFLDSL